MAPKYDPKLLAHWLSVDPEIFEYKKPSSTKIKSKFRFSMINYKDNYYN